MAKPKNNAETKRAMALLGNVQTVHLNIGLYMSMNMVKQSVNHFMGRVMFYVLKSGSISL